jgi:imidazolonepropionase-like amidohydrolase
VAAGADHVPDLGDDLPSGQRGGPGAGGLANGAVRVATVLDHERAHGLLPQAIVELTEAGLPTITALASATGLAAQACGLADRTGRLRPGLDADLLIVQGDAITDITAIRNVRTVVSRGRHVG